MRAVILVGGEGTRLRPLTLTTPKPLLGIAGRPMIEWVIESLARHGVDDVVLALAYQPKSFIDAYPDGRIGGVRVRYVVEDSPLDTAGALANAVRACGIDETFVAMNGDVLCDIDVTALRARHAASGWAATVSLHPVADPSRFGVAVTDGEGRVQAFLEKPAALETTSRLINAGVYILEPSALEHVPAHSRCSLERAVFPELAERGVLGSMTSDAYWLDAGTPAALLQANFDFVERSSAGRRTWGNSWIANSARVHRSACLERSIVSPHAIVGKGTRIRDSVVLPHAIVAAGTVVSRALIALNVVLPVEPRPA